jgi:hypothetical protein
VARAFEFGSSKRMIQGSDRVTALAVVIPSEARCLPRCHPERGRSRTESTCHGVAMRSRKDPPNSPETVSCFRGSLDYGVACGFAFGYAGTSRSAFARDDKGGMASLAAMRKGGAGPAPTASMVRGWAGPAPIERSPVSPVGAAPVPPLRVQSGFEQQGRDRSRPYT